MELSMRLAALQLHHLHSDPIFVRENLRKAGKTCGKPGGKSVGFGEICKPSNLHLHTANGEAKLKNTADKDNKCCKEYAKLRKDKKPNTAHEKRMAERINFVRPTPPALRPLKSVLEKLPKVESKPEPTTKTRVCD